MRVVQEAESDPSALTRDYVLDQFGAQPKFASCYFYVQLYTSWK